MEGTFTDTSWSPSVHSHVLCDMLNSVCKSVRALIWKGYCKLSQGDHFSANAAVAVARSQLKIQHVMFGLLKVF